MILAAGAIAGVTALAHWAEANPASAVCLIVIWGIAAMWLLPKLNALGWRFGGPSSLADVHTGVDYERYCAARLSDDGWHVRMTPATGDQGVDLIATLGSLKVAIQCKFYNQSVGNKAVQEVVAGRIHVGANAAVVISNAGYTPGARALARSTGTLLLTHDDIPYLRKRLAPA